MNKYAMRLVHNPENNISNDYTKNKIYPKLIKKKKTQKKECGPIGIAMYHTTADHCYYRDAAPFAIRTVKTWTQ